MTLEELEGREPDKVTTSIYGRRVEIYGVPTEEQMVDVLYSLIKPKLDEMIQLKVDEVMKSKKNNDNTKTSP